ncbi:MAG: three-Cys-motif partner protein TcmP [Thermoanaerobaculia bacterium]
MDDETLPDDGLPTSVVGDWAEEKYRLVECYANLFATSMKNRWECRNYIDLFAGTGRAQIRGTQKIVRTAAIRALEVTAPFDRYVFCELDSTRLGALRQRVERSHTERSVRFIEGNTNDRVDEIVAAIPLPTPGFRVLTFCFADPYQLANLQFETIRKIASRFVDFLILIPTGMDPGRNEQNYVAERSQVVAQFIGRENWRESWRNERQVGFGDFVAREFGESMRRLGYLFGGLHETHLMRNTKRKSPIYRLAMFSRNDLGEKFWRACKKVATPQGSLF